MSYFLFGLFSTLEGIGFMALMFSIFRYKIKFYWFPVLLVNVLIFFVSYLMRSELNLAGYVPLITLFILIIVIKPILDVPQFYSAIIATLGYIAAGLIQSLILLILVFLNIVTVTRVQEGITFDAYLLQSISFAFNLLISMYLFRKGWGFAFKFLENKIKGEKLFGYITVVIAIIVLIYIFLMTVNTSIEILVAIFILLLSLVLVLYFTIYKEKRDDSRNRY